jgi:hypothetical protein
MDAAGGMAQMVGHLASMHEALMSFPSTENGTQMLTSTRISTFVSFNVLDPSVLLCTSTKLPEFI